MNFSLPSSPLHTAPATASYLGILVGLACLGKYHGFALGLGLIGFCLTGPRHRSLHLGMAGWG